MKPKIYLDHAATSAPKSPQVVTRITEYLSQSGLSAGRGSYSRGAQLTQEIEQARDRVARLIHASSSQRIVFTDGGTAALNLAIQGFLNPGNHVVSTSLEHNSVIRPLYELAKQGTIEWTEVEPDPDGFILPERIGKAINKHTALICCIHASNVTGLIQPVSEICQLAQERNITTLIDAAQTVGHLEIDVQKIGCDLLAASGHKGMRGMHGSGILYLREEMEKRIRPMKFGGTGSSSEQRNSPESLPHKYEVGSPNVPALLSLGTSLGELCQPGVISGEYEATSKLLSQLLEGLSSITGITVYHADAPLQQRVPLVSFNVNGQDSSVISNILDEHYGIEVRSGLHCAPGAHQSIGTLDQGGTIRVSLSAQNSSNHVETLLQAVAEIAAAFH